MLLGKVEAIEYSKVAKAEGVIDWIERR